jgi:hypothetical protein
MNKIKINKWGKIGILSTLAIGILFIAGSAMATESAVWTTLDANIDHMLVLVCDY